MKWIDCKDKMPDPEEDVLIYAKSHTFPHIDFMITGCCIKNPKTGRIYFNLERQDLFATHWMPLPKPPRQNEMD